MTQIQRRLESTTYELIDDSDLQQHKEENRRDKLLTRALVAFVVASTTSLNYTEAARTVTDGPNDNGIDAIAILPDENKILIVQGKWRKDGKGSAALDEMIKFRDGIRELVQLNWAGFNDKVRTRRQEIEDALLESDARIEIYFVHTGANECSEDVRRRMDEFLSEHINDYRESASFHYMNQDSIHRLLRDDVQTPKITLNAELADWGQVEGEPRAVYGQVKASQVAEWHHQFNDSLFANNVRSVLHDSEVNDSIVDTLEREPELFWYFNNGITVLCDEIVKSPAYGSDRRVGNFTFSGASVVNGAQTVGSIRRAAGKNSLDDVKVMIRFISLEGASSDFATKVTRATNTQNRIGLRDFLSLDPNQARIKGEFAIEGLDYVYRSGDTDPAPENGCSVIEATVALACASMDPNLATQAKREISRLWDSSDRGYYTRLFNASTTSVRIWRSVGVLRHVDRRLATLQKDLEGRARGVVVHGNRLTLGLVFHLLPTRMIDDPTFDWEAHSKEIDSLVDNVVDSVTVVAEDLFPGNYLASLFKNATKCTELTEEALRRISKS